MRARRNPAPPPGFDQADPVLWAAARWWALRQRGQSDDAAAMVAYDALYGSGGDATPDGKPPWREPPRLDGAQWENLRLAYHAAIGLRAPLLREDAARLVWVATSLQPALDNLWRNPHAPGAVLACEAYWFYPAEALGVLAAQTRAFADARRTGAELRALTLELLEATETLAAGGKAPPTPLEAFNVRRRDVIAAFVGGGDRSVRAVGIASGLEQLARRPPKTFPPPYTQTPFALPNLVEELDPDVVAAALRARVPVPDLLARLAKAPR